MLLTFDSAFVQPTSKKALSTNTPGLDSGIIILISHAFSLIRKITYISDAYSVDRWKISSDESAGVT